jgi:hypothetical protein
VIEKTITAKAVIINVENCKFPSARVFTENAFIMVNTGPPLLLEAYLRMNQLDRLFVLVYFVLNYYVVLQLFLHNEIIMLVHDAVQMRDTVQIRATEDPRD